MEGKQGTSSAPKAPCERASARQRLHPVAARHVRANTPVSGTRASASVVFRERSVPESLRDGRDSEPPPHSPRLTIPPQQSHTQSYYDTIMSLHGLDRGEWKAAIGNTLHTMAIEAEGENRSYPAMVSDLLMTHWTRPENGGTCYDHHMQGHVDAIEALVDGWMSGRRVGGSRFRILDVSCGTGKSLETVLGAMPERIYQKLEVIANDVSSASIDAAKRTLARFHDRGIGITYTKHDISQELPEGRFDIVIFSQTLPFICDGTALMDNRLGRGIPDEKRHLSSKKALLASLMEKVRPGRGQLMVIDEHPMKLSIDTSDFNSTVETTLFNEIFRSIDIWELTERVMKPLPGIRFMGQLMTPIDRTHSMYLMAYTTAIDKTGDCPLMCAPRESEVKQLLKRMEKVHGSLIGRLQELDTRTTFLPIGAGNRRLTITPHVYDEMFGEGKPEVRATDSYNLVVLDGLVHKLGLGGYKDLLERLTETGMLQPGASVLHIDDWPRQDGVGVSNRDARILFDSAFDEHYFCGSARVGKRYGYLYAIRSF